VRRQRRRIAPRVIVEALNTSRVSTMRGGDCNHATVQAPLRQASAACPTSSRTETIQRAGSRLMYCTLFPRRTRQVISE
jgi:hypothetical protein